MKVKYKNKPKGPWIRTADMSKEYSTLYADLMTERGKLDVEIVEGINE